MIVDICLMFQLVRVCQRNRSIGQDMTCMLNKMLSEVFECTFETLAPTAKLPAVLVLASFFIIKICSLYFRGLFESVDT